MKFEATLIGTVKFKRTFTLHAMNEEDAAEIAEEMFVDCLNEGDECDIQEIYIEEVVTKK